MFKESLDPQNNAAKSADLQQFYDFIDAMPDMVMMVYDKSCGGFEGHSKEWIKQKGYEFLRKSEEFSKKPQDI